jgi:hypothetical protein
MAWATEDAKNYLDAPEGKYVDVKSPTFADLVPCTVLALTVIYGHRGASHFYGSSVATGSKK